MCSCECCGSVATKVNNKCIVRTINFYAVDPDLNFALTAKLICWPGDSKVKFTMLGTVVERRILTPKIIFLLQSSIKLVCPT